MRTAVGTQELNVTLYGETIERLDRVLAARGQTANPLARTAPGLASPQDQARIRLAQSLLDQILAALAP